MDTERRKDGYRMPTGVQSGKHEDGKKKWSDQVTDSIKKHIERSLLWTSTTLESRA